MHALHSASAQNKKRTSPADPLAAFCFFLDLPLADMQTIFCMKYCLMHAFRILPDPSLEGGHTFSCTKYCSTDTFHVFSKSSLVVRAVLPHSCILCLFIFFNWLVCPTFPWILSVLALLYNHLDERREKPIKWHNLSTAYFSTGSHGLPVMCTNW